MMTALATVVSVKETKQGYQIGLSCEQQTSCSHCSSQKSCGTGIVSKAIGNKSHAWTLMTQEDVKAGQMIEIGLPEKNLLQFASLVYLLPLAALMLGALFGQLVISPLFGGGEVSGGEGWTILCSLLFMGGGVWLARHFSTKLQSKSEQIVTLLRVFGDKIDIAERVS
jgi:sigma-E factor negative regulatory protein RseC